MEQLLIGDHQIDHPVLVHRSCEATGWVNALRERGTRAPCGVCSNLSGHEPPLLQHSELVSMPTLRRHSPVARATVLQPSSRQRGATMVSVTSLSKSQPPASSKLAPPTRPPPAQPPSQTFTPHHAQTVRPMAIIKHKQTQHTHTHLANGQSNHYIRFRECWHNVRAELVERHIVEAVMRVHGRSCINASRASASASASRVSASATICDTCLEVNFAGIMILRCC